MTLEQLQDNITRSIRVKKKLVSEWCNADLVETSDRINRSTVLGLIEPFIEELETILRALEE